MKNLYILGWIFCFMLTFANDQVAIVTKSSGKVEYKKYSEQKLTQGLQIGSSLFIDDEIQTGSDGYLIFVYLDDKSMVKVQNDTKLVVKGNSDSNSIIKQINIKNGQMKLNIPKQKKGQFTIVSPTSVASVKGTKFWVDIDEIDGDQFFGLEGIVEIRNLISGDIVLMEANITTTSLPSGTIDIAPTVPNEVPLDMNEGDSDEEFEEDFEQDSETNQETDDSTDTEGELEIKLQNQSGEEKKIIIRYK
ncbi:MAG: FecR domain-containing protein [Candidatus Marinimicrobia bacterium]|nr:FecR domain-containing protein [Candidatus Neomarinimicrobiota bacterium]MBL7023481.1 FecR domain-containing protein [Candidatus Neomarinimicrobiota bacterium]MBL7109264.1 FecR domain-containing protein [Candidatus Neomarinimicrobiota bacterium]